MVGNEVLDVLLLLGFHFKEHISEVPVWLERMKCLWFVSLYRLKLKVMLTSGPNTNPVSQQWPANHVIVLMTPKCLLIYHTNVCFSHPASDQSANHKENRPSGQVSLKHGHYPTFIPFRFILMVVTCFSHLCRYFQYKQLWDMFKLPGERDRRALRLEIKVCKHIVRNKIFKVRYPVLSLGEIPKFLAIVCREMLFLSNGLCFYFFHTFPWLALFWLHSSLICDWLLAEQAHTKKSTVSVHAALVVE